MGLPPGIPLLHGFEEAGEATEYMDSPSNYLLLHGLIGGLTGRKGGAAHPLFLLLPSIPPLSLFSLMPNLLCLLRN